MRALTWQGREDVRVETVPDPQLIDSTDAIIRVTSTAICGSDLHLYSVLGAYLEPGDILGHESMGIVEEVGRDAGGLAVGDRVVIPFGIACGTCWMCTRGLQSQCETTQVRSEDKGAARASLAFGWRARAVPVGTGWLDMGTYAPLMDTARATRVLAWAPRVTATHAFAQLVAGMADGVGTASPPMRARRG